MHRPVPLNSIGNVTAQTFGNGVKEAKTFNTDGTPVAQTDTVPTNGGGGNSDSDVPTLPEWGAILLGSLLLLIGYRQQKGNSSLGGGRFFGLLALGFTVLLLQSLGLPQAFADEALTYDANGNIQTRTLPGGTTTYGYDELNRLTSEAGPAKTQSLTYDPNDNRTSDGTGTETYVPSSDRIATANGQSFTLDAAGNITQARGLSFTWNQAVGQIRTVSQGGTLLATYYYDYKGRRTRKVTTAAAPQGAGTVIYTYDLYDRLKGELDGAGHPLRTYVWREDTPVSIIVQGATETALYLEVDHLNTPIAARDQTGKLVWAWESDAFGSTLPNEDPGSTGNKVTINLRFPGQYFDRESGLHYNYRRYYDPKLGRYLSPDPVGLAGGNNLYSYVGGNPLTYTDPLGLDTGVTIWQPVGWRGSSFGHVSTTINGTTYSFGQEGMSVMPKSEYLERNGFRNGTEVKLDLTPKQEQELVACLSKPQGEYSAATNNCGAPIQRCLISVGVNDFYKAGNTTIGINERHVLPVDLGNGLLSSKSAKTAIQYPASRPSGGISAPWAR